MSHVMNTYARLPVAFSHGKGSRVTDTEGREYLDALSGIAVNTLGHAHPRLVAAIAEQAGRLIHTSNLYGAVGQERLADRLCALSGMQEVFFGNSGAEANEAAIKLARFYGHKKGIELPTVIVMEKSFHGRTMATLSATGNYKVQVGFEPLVAGFVRVPYGDLDAIRAVAEQNPNIVAVMLEVIQGEGGIHLREPAYYQGVRQLCDAHDWLMICDEVQCGMGRTGKWFGYQQVGVQPDIATLAKGLGSGVPIGACMAGGRAAGLFGPGNHGSTFGGNPLVCAAALTTLDCIEEEGLLANAENIGKLIRQRLAAGLADAQGVVDIRGHGLMIGIELDRPCGVLVTQGLAAGLLINVTGDTVVRLLPPLNFSERDASELVDRMIPLIKAFLAG
ncbi:acetylornithine aminotransferase [Azonexus fungiphilus]|uniref:Acetylornithine aminotransferase n=1 Tax=Azonexus fungiphilus TaxID=146940 RepID=A0A495W8B4_9RHOO|nr:aspartate aminotransferase family protein [Azonexus fungiphilus]RKT58011.1 acetylornithine aminotransferase [Azonexus fungiphilus]